MKFYKVLLLMSVLSLSYASSSMRRCMILPIKDSVGGAIGFPVFSKVEKYLQASKWCYYQSNSEIINTLGNYKNTLDRALNSPDVLKIISEKTNSGSLIKVNLSSFANGTKVSVKVIGANGKDVYFNEETDLNSDDIDVIAQTINNWLDVYEKNIPYDARVIGVLGTQFTVDIGSDFGLYRDYEVDIVRPVKKQVHPLLKEIVDWKTMPVATAKVFHTGKSSAQLKLIEYKRDTLIQTDDWVIISKNNASNPIKKNKYNDIDVTDNSFSFGKLGRLALALDIGTGSNTISGSSIKKISGFNFGISAEGEVYATRNYWVGFNVHRTFGSYSQEEGSFSTDSFSMNGSVFKLKAGYKYLPLGFFYGPQVDLYFGYARYGYGFDTQSADGVGEMTFSGILLGTRGSIPLIKDIRLYLKLDFLFSPSYDEEISIYGDADSVRNFNIGGGVEYKYSPNMDFFGGFDYYNSKAEFGSTSVSLKNTMFKAGAIFAF